MHRWLETLPGEMDNFHTVIEGIQYSMRICCSLFLKIKYCLQIREKGSELPPVGRVSGFPSAML